MSHRRNETLTAGLALCAAVLLLAGPALAYEETRTFSTDKLTLHNVIGQVDVEGHGGSDFEVVVRVQGAGATKGAIRLEATDDELQILFPSGNKTFVYPAMGRGETTIRFGDDRWMSKMNDGGRITVTGSGPGLELWADVTIRVPTGANLELKHGVGAVRAVGVEGKLELATRSGSVSVERSYGDLAVATGSGEVVLDQVDGDKVRVATGSGSVRAERVDGREVKIATGSGEIDVISVRGRELNAATGSGDIRIEEVDSDTVHIGTGSGSVVLAIDRMGRGEIAVGTGSGDIDFKMPAGASAKVHAETDHGKIAVALDGAEYKIREDDEVEMTIGGGDAEIKLGSGSGDIRIRS